MLADLVIIASLSLLMYARTINYGYVIDDDVASRATKTGKKWVDLWRQFSGKIYFNNRLAHASNIIMHTLTCLLIYLAFGANKVSLVAALLFCINPANNQVAVWLSGRTYAINATLVLLGVWLTPIFPVIYPITYWWSGNALLAPLIFLAKQPYWFIALLPITFYFLRRKVLNTIDSRMKMITDEMRDYSFRKLIIVFKTLGYYICFCVLPLRLGLCHYYMNNYGMSKEETEHWYKLDRFFWFGIACTVVFILGTIFYRGQAIFGLFWFGLFIAQWLNFISCNHMISERYVYLANIGLMYAIASILLSIPFGLYILVALATFYVTKLQYSLPMYETYMAFFKMNSEEHPKVASAYNQYGLALMEFGNAGSGFDTFIRGVQVRPNDFRLNYNISNFLLGQGDARTAAPFIKAAERNMLVHNKGGTQWGDTIKKFKDFCLTKGVDIDKMPDVAAVPRKENHG